MNTSVAFYCRFDVLSRILNPLVIFCRILSRRVDVEMHILVTSMLSALTACSSDPYPGKVSLFNRKVNSTAVAQFCTGFDL